MDNINEKYDFDISIPQDNNLWKLFRILVEDEEVPDEITLHIKKSLGANDEHK